MRNNPIKTRIRNIPATNNGVTLVELLISSAIGLILMLMALTMFSEHMRTSAQLEAYNRLQQHWKRVQFLIEQDIAESTGLASTSASCGSGTNHVTMSFEKADSSAASGTVPAGSVTYYHSGQQLRRCGLPISSLGLLSESGSDDQLVASRVKNFTPNISNPRSPRFILTLTDPIGTEYSNTSTSTGTYSRSRIVDTGS